MMIYTGNYLKNVPDVLTVKDLQRVLKIGKNSALKLLQEGSITAHKIGGKRWRIYKEDLEEYINYS